MRSVREVKWKCSKVVGISNNFWGSWRGNKFQKCPRRIKVPTLDNEATWFLILKINYYRGGWGLAVRLRRRSPREKQTFSSLLPNNLLFLFRNSPFPSTLALPPAFCSLYYLTFAFGLLYCIFSLLTFRFPLRWEVSHQFYYIFQYNSAIMFDLTSEVFETN